MRFGALCVYIYIVQRQREGEGEREREIANGKNGKMGSFGRARLKGWLSYCYITI
jgi:hypothetical protein